VLNLAHEPAYKYVYSKLDELLSEHQIAFVKWDMNRPHVQATLQNGAAGTHEQTLAVYRLIDQLRNAHQNVEFESCASGGGRIDHEILRRADRVWTSDCIDPFRRQNIQRGASMFVPNEIMGAHIGAEKAHTTGRSHSLGFRAISAVFGHLGLELDLTKCSDDELQRLRQVIAWHKKHRDILHAGDAVRFDPVSTSQICHGVYSVDRSEAMVSIVQLTSDPENERTQFLRLPGLVADRKYQVTTFDSDLLVGRDVGVFSGQQLESLGLKLPVLQPESGMIFHLLCV
jgi:alpha-galactosidase